MKIIGDYLIFSTGKKVYVNWGIVGIREDLSISKGADDGIDEDKLTKVYLHLFRHQLPY